MKRKLKLNRKAHHEIKWWFTGGVWVLSSVSAGLGAVYGNLSPEQHARIPPWGDMLIISIIFLGLFIGTMLKWESGDE